MVAIECARRRRPDHRHALSGNAHRSLVSWEAAIRDYPGAARLSVDRIQLNGPVPAVAHIELDEPAFFEILAHHRFGHIAPADAFLKQHVLRAEIGQAPCLVPTTPRSWPCGEH